MSRFKECLQILWPQLIPLTDENQKKYDGWIRDMGLSVQSSDWSKDSEVALEESRRLFGAEIERRKGADAKAGIYLAAITALIPVLVSLLPSLWGEKAGKWLGCIGLLIFALAVAYLLRAGAWAFRTLQVSGFVQVGALEMVSIWKKKSPKAALAKQLSLAMIRNYSRVNRKISGIKMTHAYLLRAFLSFTILLITQAIWPIGIWALEEAGKLMKAESVFPTIMCFS